MKKINYSLTEEQKQQIIADFTNKLNTGLEVPSIKYNLDLDYETELKTEPKAELFITATAYAKMMMYVRDTDTEIAWHGTAYRTTTTPGYYIKNVFLYPQIVRSVTVDTDQEKYNEWKTSLDDETFNHLNFQGHSHVNMGVTPSGVDTAYYDTILKIYKQEQPDSFYIFTVMNKRGEMYLIIYDLAKNLVYNKQDINLHIIDEDNEDILAEIKEQKQTYCESPKITTPTYVGRYKTQTTFNQEFFDPCDPANYYEEKDYDKLLKQYADAPTETDEMFDDLDKKYKNLHLSACGKRRKKKK